MIGNRAVGQLVARTPEESVDLLEPAIMGAHVDVTQINRTLLPYSKDQESFDKVAEAYETKAEVTLREGARDARAVRGARRRAQERAVARLPAAKADAAGGGAS